MGVNMSKKQKIGSIILLLVTLSGTSCLFLSFLFDNLYLGFYGLLVYFVINTLGLLAVSGRLEELQGKVDKGGCNGCNVSK